MEDQGNIFTRLVEDSKNQGHALEGYIAYCLYKQDKINYMQIYLSSHKDATEQEIKNEKDNFRNINSTDEKIIEYTKNARKIVEELRVDDLQLVVNDTVTDLYNLQEEQFMDDMEKWWAKGKKSRWSDGIIQNVIGAIVYAAILVLFSVLIKNDTSPFFDNNNQTNNAQTEQATPSPAISPENTINYK